MRVCSFDIRTYTDGLCTQWYSQNILIMCWVIKVYIHIYICIHIYIYIYICIHAHIYIYIHIYIYFHTYGYPNSWMVKNWKSESKKDDLGVPPISGTPLNIYIYIHIIHIYIYIYYILYSMYIYIHIFTCILCIYCCIVIGEAPQLANLTYTLLN